jgi:beta-galactosidase
VEHFIDGPAAGRPAITRNALGEGSAWYLSTRFEGATLGAFIDDVLADAGLTVVPPPTGLERVIRVADDGTRYLVAINHAERDAVIDAPGADVATGDVTDAATLVRAGATRVIRLAD